ncbi:PQQ-binding-like beta-propeller repeat protein [Actinoplanes solisilvae]|uniref:outer membrane protein assembly factor BamB family protein n=1 Tax=Actinoplanes solisilvae TaxID=2486853 RepID=UPI000FDB94E5|nr:PQQ-binding-like beta-propeller repeat protein [Actinoplanes solisilvae]
MALIELDLTGRPDHLPRSRPPARRYRLPGLLLVAVLALAAGGAAPILPVLWRYVGAVPAPMGPEAPFQLTGGRIFTTERDGKDRITTAWSLAGPPREVWSTRFPVRETEPDEISFGGLNAVPAGGVVLLSDGPATTVVDATTGERAWSSPVGVTPLAGGRTGIVQDNEFRDGTLYDQSSGEPGLLFFGATGEPHTEPPLRTDVRGVDLATGRTLWTLGAPGSVNVLVAPGDAPAVLLLSSDRLQRIDGTSGRVVASIALPALDSGGPTGGELVDGLMMVYYGHDGVVAREAAYSADTLGQLWSRAVPEVLLDRASCAGLHCSGSLRALDVLDPRTGEPRWRAPTGVDLMKRGGYVIEIGNESGLPERLVDPGTGAARVDLAGWRAEVMGDDSQPILLRRSLGAESAFGVVVPRRDAVQPLGVTGWPVGDCTSDRSHVACRAGGELRIWAYRA